MISELKIKNVVDRYISVEIARQLNQDAGFRGEHQLGRMIDYLGQLPDGCGGGGSNNAMIYQISLLFKEPNDPQTRWACKAMQLVEKQSINQHRSLVAWSLFKNRPDPINECDYHTDERIAALLDVSRSTFLKSLYRGKATIADYIELRECDVA
ncbi:hypothetical protein [uncultured Amphritea sp.]|uniref:hypothetical protein n=1 Tax=uncultured Amphritea sp. TaxID=981605 RepID=UPI002614E7C6|nr:hypothetical protein [uncultured Amphritea sp.]